MKSFGYSAALLGDLHDAKIELLQFDEGGQVLVQCAPMPDKFAEGGLGAGPLVGPLGLEPRTS